MQSLKRKMQFWADADARAAESRRVAAQARTGQVARSTIDVGDDTVSLGDALLDGVGAAEVSAEQQDDLAQLNDDQALNVDWYVDGQGVDVDDVIDAGELADENVQNDVDSWDIAADAAEEAHTAAMNATEAHQRVDEAQAVADQAAADALAAATASAVAAQAAADAKAAADAAQGDASQAILDAEAKSEAARLAAEEYARAEAAAAEAAAVAEAAGDASAKAEAARLAAEAAAAADAKLKADAAEAAAKVDAAAAQAAADAAAAQAGTAQAGTAQQAAEAARFLTEGLYQVIPSDTEPTTSPTGALKAGDQWWVIGAGDLAGKFVGVKVYNGSEWQYRQLVGNSVLVPGSVGNVLIEEGGVTAEKMAASFFYGREFHGGLFKGGKFVLDNRNQVGIRTVYDNPGTSLEGVRANSNQGVQAPARLSSQMYRSAPSSFWLFDAGETITFSGQRLFDLVEGHAVTVSMWVYSRFNPTREFTIGFGDRTKKVAVPGSVWTKVELVVPAGASFGKREPWLSAKSAGPFGAEFFVDDVVVTGGVGLDTGLTIERDQDGYAVLRMVGTKGEILFRDGVASFTGPVTHAGDTGWANVTVPGATGTCQWRRRADKIEVRFNITFTTALGAGVAKAPAFTLPTAARPTDEDAPLSVLGAGTQPAGGYIEAGTGAAALRNHHTSAVSRFFGTGTWPARI